MINDDLNQDRFLFADEVETPPTATKGEPWKVLIVDDDAEIHTITKLALNGVMCFERTLSFSHAHSASEALQLLKQDQTFAVLILDVVMESDDAGLQLVEQIRNDLRLDALRIILRTGQAGMAPEVDIIAKYDINDYKSKTDLTRTKLLTSIYSAIRCYRQFLLIKEGTSSLERVAQSAFSLQGQRSVGAFAKQALIRMSEVLKVPANGFFACRNTKSSENEDDDSEVHLLACTGRDFSDKGLQFEQIKDEVLKQDLVATYISKSSGLCASGLFFHIVAGECELVIFQKTNQPLGKLQEKLADIMLVNISVGFENVYLVQKLSFAAYKDALTQLPNRTEFVNLLEKYREKHEMGDTVFLVDVESFSDINDGLGPSVGNQLLVSVARRLQEVLPKGASVARAGPDVFGIICFGDELSDKIILESFNYPFKAGEHLIPLNVNIGAVYREYDSETGLVVLRKVTIALNRAKREKQHRCVYYAKEMDEETQWRLDIAHKLRDDFFSEKLQVWFQPQVCLSTGNVIGAEALLRWPIDDSSFIPPSTFVPLAEYSGLVVDIGRWVLEQSCQMAEHLAQVGLGHLKVGVNVSLIQFKHHDFVNDVLSILSRHDISPGQIELEITESVLMDHPKSVICALQAFRDQGITIAIDDFGTGYSSLSYLQRLPLDRIKIDRQFVLDIENPQGSIIVETIIGLGEKLGLMAIAEGIETEGQELALKALGCKQGQGFLYHKPQPQECFKQMLIDQR